MQRLPRLLLVFSTIIFFTFETILNIMILFIIVKISDFRNIFFRILRLYSISLNYITSNGKSIRIRVFLFIFLFLLPFF